MYVTLFTLHHYSSCMLHMSLYYWVYSLEIILEGIANINDICVSICMLLYTICIPIYTICMLSYDSNIPCYVHGWLTSHQAICWLMASYDTCYYMLSYYIIYICYCIIISYYIIVIIIIFIYIQTNHGNDDMNLCKSYFINDIVTHI